MNEYAATAAVALIIASAVTCMVITSNNNESKISIEASKAGLQQCVIEKGVATYIVWQKECSK